MKKQTTVLRRRRFERIVVLVDITVVLLQNEPKSYAAHIFNSVSRILKQCNEHSKFSTLWGYKFFDPCVFHMVARSKIGEFLGGVQMSEKFNAFAPNLEKFGKVLDSIVNNHRQYSSGEVRGEYIVNAISEVSCGEDYTWDPLLASDSSSSDEDGKRSLATKDRLAGDGAKRDSNVIILFSSVPTSRTEVNCFFNVPQLVGDCQPDPSVQVLLTEKFRKGQEALQSKNIQVCFVDVPRHQDLWSDERLETVLKPTPARNLVLKSLSGLVKKVIASELLVVSPTLVPCNLVWNTMADLGIDKSRKRSYARIFCKDSTLLCDVQLQRFNAPSTSKGTPELKEKLLLASKTLDIFLNSVLPKSSLNMKLGSERFLVQSGRPSAPLIDEDRDSFGDKVLQLLDHNAFRPGQPGWQLLLLSLASQESVCEVSLCNQENCHSLEAVLEPFTSDSAILTVSEKEIMQTSTDMLGSTRVNRSCSINTGVAEEFVSRGSLNTTCRKDAADYSKHEGVKVISSRKRRKVAASDVDSVINWQEYWEREGTISSTELTSGCGTVISRYIEGGKASQLLRNMDNFLKEIEQRSRLNTDPVGLALTVKGVEQSSGTPCAPAAHPRNSDAMVLPGMTSGRGSEALASDDLQMQEFREPLAMVDAEVQQESIAAVEVNALAQGGDTIPSLVSQKTSEEAKEYISSVRQKLEGCLSSADVDRGRFAELLVAESQESLYVLARQSEDYQQRSAVGELSILDLNKKIATKLKKLLLISPKKLLAKYKDCVDGSPGCAIVDEKVKELELQILLRLEMLALDEGRLLEQKAKDELVDDVCKLLDSIQFHLDGGLFGGESLSKYCFRLLGSRYKDTIPLIVSKIFLSMELGGCPVPQPSNSGPESPPEVLVKLPSKAGDVLPRETGVSQDRVSLTENVSGSATGDVSLSGGDSSLRTVENGSKKQKRLDDCSLQLQFHVLEKGQKKKGSCHFASHASSLLRVRKFKSSGRHTSTRSKLSNGRGETSGLNHDDPVRIVCQTPAPLTAPSCHRPDEVTEPATLVPPRELTAPTRERMSVEQSPGVLEGTPFVRRKLSLQNVSKENPTRSDIVLIERSAYIYRTSDAVPNPPLACPSKMIPRLCVLEPWRRSVLSRDSPIRKQGVVSGPLSFSALLESVAIVPGKIAVAGNSGSNLGSRLFHNDDDDIDDDDEDGIISTPFKFNASDQSLPSWQSSQSGFTNCHKRLDLFTGENTRDATSFPHSPTVHSIRPFLPAGLPDASAMGDTWMSQKGGSIEAAQLLEHESSSRSSPKTECIAHPKALHKDSCPEDVTLGKVLKAVWHSSALGPRSPLGTIPVNSAQYASVKESSSMELRSVSDIPARDAPGNYHGDESASATVHDKENQSSVPRKRSKSRSGLAYTGPCERITRSTTLQEQSMARGSAVRTKRRRGRID